MRPGPAAALALLGVFLAAGCVERKLLIRSEPPGAPVWIDEEYAGRTPPDYPFVQYGPRLIRVGPIRDEKGRIRYEEKEGVVDVDPPYYQKFPLDAFYEWMYPRTLVDVHEAPVFVLKSRAERPAARGEERVRRLREEARQFREEALYGLPEEQAAE